MFKFARTTVVVVTLIFSFFSVPAVAESGWIGDSIYVPLRSGAGNNYRIINRGLKSGTEVTILRWAEGADWVQIRNGSQTGYVEAQYVSRKPPAAIELAQREKAFAESEATISALGEEVAALKNQVEKLGAEKQALQTQLTNSKQSLGRLQKAAAEPLKLERNNRELTQKVELLSSELNTVKQENTELQGDRLYRGWRYALLTVFLGMVLGWVIKMLSARQRSTWS